MAGFDDSNDIKITTSLDTEGAVKAAQDLKTSIESAIKATAGQFDQLQKASKQLAAVLKDQATKEVADTKAKLDQEIKASAEAGRQEVAIAQQTANQKVDVVEKAIKRTISAEQRRLQELKVAARQEIELEKTKRTQMLKDIAQLNKERAIIRRTRRAELSPEMGGIAGAGKLSEAFNKTLAGMSIQLGNVNIGLGTFIGNFKQFGVVGTGLASLTPAVSLIRKLDQEIDRLAASANKIEGLRAGFETLQRTVGQDPSSSIDKLRQATQGLVSDIDLYQRANQAVLLGVPTKIFNEAAAAAVKLGRAMGIDAAFGLESLSLGLGRQSRLYLDNLGIIVSAEEAYQRFATSIGKSAQDLTDAEKRAAFFAEALRKIQERAEQLPDPLDSVGVSLQKLEAAQTNANQKFSEGFNSASLLIKAYQEQARITQQSVAINERFGQAIGVLSGGLKSIANIFRDFGLISKIAISDLTDAFADLTKEEQLSTLEGKIEKLKVSINGLRESRSKADLGPTLSKRLAEEEDALRKAQEEAEKLREEIAKLRGEAQNPIKINVDLTEITQAQNDFKNFFATLKQQASEAGGRVEVPGVNAEAIDKVAKAYENLYLKQLQGKLTQEQFNAEFANIEKAVELTAPAAGKIEEYAKQVSNLTEQIKSGKGDTTELNANLETARQKFEAAKSAAGLYGKQVDQLGKVLKNAEGAAKKTFSEIQRNQTDVSKGVKRVEKEFESFVKSLRRALGSAIPDNFQKELVRIFNKGALSSKEFEDALIQLGKKAQDAGVDMEAFKKEIADLQKLAEQGIKIEIDADTTKAKKKIEDDLQESLKRAQSGVPNIREMIYGKDPSGKAQGGGFFGFDTSELVGPETQKELQAAFGAETFAGVEAAIAKAIIDGLKLALRLAFEKFTRDDAPQIAEEIGTLLGGDIGGIIGKLIGENIKRNTQDLASTKERKNIDRYFADLFDGERLAIVLEGQLTGAIDQATGEAIRNLQPQVARISDLTLEGMTAMAGNVDFGGDRFRNYFETLSSDAQAAFNGIGIAFGSLNGIATEQARLIGVALANNIGGSLQNLQVLIQGTGESFENLANAVLKSFLDAQLTIEEAYNALVQLQNLYQVGLPDALGDYEQAARNLFNILADDRPGRYAVDSLRDIGAEGIEAKKTFDAVIASLGQTFTFTAEQQTRLFEALRINGITSLAQLQAASDEQLLAILRNIELIRENATAPLVTAPQIPTTTTSAPRPSGSRRKSPEQEAREKLREETKKLLRESQAYLDILGKVTSGELAQAAAGLQIVQLQKEIEGLLKRRNDLEKKLNDELDKGSKANKQRLAKIAAELDGVNDKLEEFKKKAEGTTRVFKELDIKGVIPFIKDANNLGVIAKQIGVEFDKASSILVKGFLQGRLSLAELRAELDKTKETLGPGIPNAVGAVTDAFQNLIDAGTQGGQFSVDALTDIFAEFREKFQTEGSALREAERKQLNENLRVARETLAGAVGPEATEKARKTLEQAKKTLDDFNASVAAPDLSDLRAQLEASFGREQIDKFFRALDESGLKTFEDFEKAGNASVVGILTKLESLGFSFNQTSQDIVDAQAQLIAAEKEANAGLDPMQEAINLIKSLNEGAGQLPPVFNATTQAIESLNGPLGALASGFDDILEKVAKLKGPFETDVVFNISTTGDAGGKALVEALFGDGTGTTQDILSTTSGSSESNAAKIAKWKKEVADLKRRGLNDRRRNRIALLQKRIAQLGG